MADLKDLFLKIAQNRPLTPRELDELGRFGTETQLRNAFLAGNTTPQNTLDVNEDFEIVFSETLVKNTASIFAKIPSSARHIMIVGAGRIDQNAGGSIWCQFNSDTGNNYNYYFIRTDGTTVTTGVNGGQSKVFLGSFAVSTAASNIVGSLQANINDAQGTFYKTVISSSINHGYGYQFTSSGDWRSTNNLQTIEIFGTDGTTTKGTASILAGSVISIYGLK
jgi:hypothetical protein